MPPSSRMKALFVRRRAAAMLILHLALLVHAEYAGGDVGRKERAMGGYEKLVAGCVIFIPFIAVLLAVAWKNWHGEWLAFADLARIADGSESLQKRRGRRAALVYLVWVVALVGVIGITAFSALSGFVANLELASSTLAAFGFVGGSWLVATSRREARTANTAAGEGLEFAGEYVLNAHRGAMLGLAMLAVLAAEIACSLIV